METRRVTCSSFVRVSASTTLETALRAVNEAYHLLDPCRQFDLDR